MAECSWSVNDPGSRTQMLAVRQTQHKSRSNGGKSKRNVCKPLLLSVASREVLLTICIQEKNRSHLSPAVLKKVEPLPGLMLCSYSRQIASFLIGLLYNFYHLF